MRWKITGQILGLLLVVLPVLYLSLLVFGWLIFGAFRDPGQGNDALYARASQITLAFEPNLTWQDGQFSVAADKLAELHALGAWLQVLDENGSEVYQQDKPAGAPLHYTPAELILNYRFSGAIKDPGQSRGYTLFVAKAQRGQRQFSYIIGFPDRDVVKSMIYVNPRTIMLDFMRMLGGALLASTLVVLLVAYLYGSQLARKLAEIIEGIQRLARADYPAAYAETGIYASVYHNLNRLALTLQAHEKERQRLETARDEWIANISHDVKTPLSSLRGYAELLADPDYHFDEDEVRQYARIMQDKSGYMESLVEDLRLTYQLKNAALPLQKQPENLVELLRETVIDRLNDPRYAEAPLRFEPACEAIPFDCDRRLMQRAFTNLLVNALVHNPPGTPVTVSIAGGETICISFQDQGQGIPAAEVERLFERYYRGTNTSEAHQGSGLGLAITREIIQAHGGRVEVSSQLGAGTQIRIVLPG